MREKKLNNPFLLVGFHGMKYFCDRKKELSALDEHIENERNVVLYSWRRLGKTALLRCFIRILESRKMMESVYVDLLGTRDMQTATMYISQAVLDRFGKTSGGITASFQKFLWRSGLDLTFDPVSGVPKISLGFRNVNLGSSSLGALGEFLMNRKSRIIIILDEFQQISRYTDADGESVFRSWVQSFPGIRFIFSGSHRQMMLSMFSEKNRPFYLSTQLIQLDSIDRDIYSEFIGDHFRSGQKTIETHLIENIFEWSRMQTYCIQLVCNKLYGQFQKIDLSSLQAVYAEILEQEGALFADYANLLTGLQWKVLKAVANAEPLENPLSQVFLGKFKLGAPSSVSAAMDKLMKNEIVVKDHGVYVVHEVLLSRWLQSL